MKTLTVFYLEGCPYCRNAIAAVKELRAEMPAFAAVRIDWIEERKNAAIADRYDYYNVPCIFCGDVKLYECSPGDDYFTIRQQFKNAAAFAAGE